MRSLLFDELRATEVEAVTGYLDREAQASGLEGLYWLALPEDLWNESQFKGLKEEPALAENGFRLAIEVGPDWLRLELLVRSDSLHNTGGGQADENQVIFALNWADEMAEELGLRACL